MKSKKGSFSISNFFRSFTSFRAFNKLTPDQRNIVFYSESGQDWHHFEKTIKSLLTMSKQVCYVTSDRKDPGLALANPLFKPFFIGEGFWQIYFFQFLKADCMVLTMIDLHIFQLKRSISPVHYVYLFHAMGSTHMVDFENSYDHYDSILCVGPHQIAEIRKREQLKNLPAKNLVEHGYGRVEELMQQSEAQKRSPTKPYTILLAPTWGDQSILNICGKKLIGILLDAGYNLILRPHYQTGKLTPGIIDDILTTYGNHASFKYVNLMGDTKSLFDSDLLICDWSSTSIEYALGLEKPVLYIDVPRRVRNQNYLELGIEPMEVSIRSEVGKVLSPYELEKAPTMIDSLLSYPEQFSERIVSLRKKIIFNLGKSIEVGAKEIGKIAEAVRNNRISKK
jgi:hypothetical protein